ncbi:putative receptor-like protein kinase At3g47110 [Lycium ferocissimum]|uniref:putative receptor-like protein kinase At3g47110 n=1 Tax=Lycium ferocissimum TaxID=112874 RepID=UPI002815D336|nr:putative receptor-like protein kinase At3g47110 [Lycium ferocissimum]
MDGFLQALNDSHHEEKLDKEEIVSQEWLMNQAQQLEVYEDHREGISRMMEEFLKIHVEQSQEVELLEIAIRESEPSLNAQIEACDAQYQRVMDSSFELVFNEEEVKIDFQELMSFKEAKLKAYDLSNIWNFEASFYDKDLNQLLVVSYQSILKVTNGFSASNLIGVGSHGYVYKIIFEMDGKHVAIKVLNFLQHGAIKSFIAECVALRNVRHQNLVKPLTACSGVDYGGNEFKPLVYEFMANRSLEDWLHPDNSRANVQPRRLGFFQRLNIAIDVASAIDYLHNDCQISIVHCDLKSNNILLDNELVAHVGASRLSRFLHLTDETTCRIHTSSTTFKGSIGFIAPEYGMGSDPTMHGDVYSFGIVLLEMLTRKRPTDDMFGGDLSLHDFVRNPMADGSLEIVNPVLDLEEEEINRESSRILRFMRRQKMVQGLISLFRIGVACSELELLAQCMIQVK